MVWIYESQEYLIRMVQEPKSKRWSCIPTFMGQVIRGESLTVFGDGSQTRSCYVDDRLKAYINYYILAILNQSTGNPEEIALIDFAKEIIDLGGNNNKIIYKPLPVNDPIKENLTYKSNKYFKLDPKISRKKGLENTYDYFRNIFGRIK